MRTHPRATYRVQLRQDFDFDAAAAIVPYLEELGISHLYCSPYMQAAEGSSHGYDVVDPTRVSTALGGDPGLRRLDDALRAAHMGQLLDTVPNHLCVTDRANTWWWDVLRNGRDSPYARFFDIEWDAPAGHGRVVLGVLGAPRAELLACGALQVVRGPDGDFELHHGADAFPLAPGTASAPGPVSLETLDAQHYILETARSGASHINYRRFVDVSSLAAVCVDVDAVFDAVLSRTLALIEDGTVDGLRVDHIDGLREPGSFTSRLRSVAPTAWLVVEKILATGEDLPNEWPIEGTTGYEFGALVTSVMVLPEGLSELSDVYRRFTGDVRDFPSHSHGARRDVLETELGAELGRLVRVANAAGIEDARRELAELLVGMPRYRVYPRPGEPLSIDDARAIAIAEGWARQSGGCDEQRLGALLDSLRGHDEPVPASRELRERFQQVAAAVMAKGVEDTAFYRSVRLVALNDVGSDPDRTCTVDEFHQACMQRSARHPLGLLATTTHDSKRAEDARLRVGMLSEMPGTWREAVARLDAVAATHRGVHPPSREAEYLFYQTMVGAHPLDADRACAYMLKAAREAKIETSWVEPNRPYEADLERFVRAMVLDPDAEAVIGEVIAAMTPEWQALSLSQTLIKLTASGVPDIYQGSELWDLRLVDPDNRTSVDYEVRRKLLRAVMSRDNDGFMSRLPDGGPKLRLIATALAVRARHPEAFGSASGYRPAAATGIRSEHAICFARTSADEQPVTVTIAFRWPLLLRPGWGDTRVELPEGRWRDALSGRDVGGGEQRLETLLEEAPIALLERA